MEIDKKINKFILGCYNNPPKIKNTSNSFYMFIEDFACDFGCSNLNRLSNIYDLISHSNDKVSFELNYFKDRFYDEIKKTYKSLLEYGKTFLYIIDKVDKDNQHIKTILINFNPIASFKILFHTIFIYKSKNRLLFHIVNNKNIIKYRLNDIGLNYRLLLKKINRIDNINPTKLFLNNTNLLYDKHICFEERINANDFNILKITKDFFWLARNYNNRYLSDSYSLYRRNKLINFKRKVHGYLIDKINYQLSFINNYNSDRIQIKYDNSEIDYYEKFSKKEMSFKELSDKLFSI